MGHAKKDVPFQPLQIAVLTVSDTRVPENDTSGDSLVAGLTEAGHTLADRTICKDDVYQLRAVVSKWIADEDVQAVLVTGGTGFTLRDTTPEALMPLFDKAVEGYGELFRQLSYQEIGSAALLSRGLAGLAAGRVVFVLPGSRGAVTLAMEKLILPELGHLAGEAVKTG